MYRYLIMKESAYSITEVVYRSKFEYHNINLAIINALKYIYFDEMKHDEFFPLNFMIESKFEKYNTIDEVRENDPNMIDQNGNSFHIHQQMVLAAVENAFEKLAFYQDHCGEYLCKEGKQLCNIHLEEGIHNIDATEMRKQLCNIHLEEGIHNIDATEMRKQFMKKINNNAFHTETKPDFRLDKIQHWLSQSTTTLLLRFHLIRYCWGKMNWKFKIFSGIENDTNSC